MKEREALGDRGGCEGFPQYNRPATVRRLMSKRQHGVKDGEHYASVTETALGGLHQAALESGDCETLEQLGSVSFPAPYEPIPHDEIRAMRRREGRLQAVGIGMAAEANVPKALSLARRQANYTQAEAAEIVGITPLSLSRYETGERMPSVRMLVTLSTLYGVHVERLLGIIDGQHERLLDSYDFATPTAREKILEVAEGVQAGRSPEARGYAAADAQRLREHHINQRKQRLEEEQQYLDELYEQEQDGHGLNRYTDGMIERCQSSELRETMIRLRDEGTNEWTEEELSAFYDWLESEKQAIKQLIEQRGI